LPVHRAQAWKYKLKSLSLKAKNMFERVLIAEDQQSMNFWMLQTLKELEITDAHYACYCDDALTRIKNCLKDGAPFDLLITDLSFVDDGRTQSISNGADLIKAVRQDQPTIKVLVFSSEPNPSVVNMLFDKLAIDGYVHKGRTDTIDLKAALAAIYKGKKFIPEAFRVSIRQKNAFKFSNYDVAIIEQIAGGANQNKIPDYLKQQNMKPTSLSSIEKRLAQIKDELGFKKNEQLIAYCKDLKII
jgi:two-component system capsular synthesis response regulator RcsB